MIAASPYLKQHDAEYLLGGSLVGAIGLIARRRKLVISAESVSFTPWIDATWTISLATVTSIVQKEVNTDFGYGGAGVPGIEITAHNQVPLSVPLNDLPTAAQDEAFEMLLRAWKVARTAEAKAYK